jgi:hypothetical protein
MGNKRNRLTRAYLLRCWQEGRALRSDELRWRYSLEQVLPERTRQGFDDLESLVAFLRGELKDTEGCKNEMEQVLDSDRYCSMAASTRSGDEH